MNALKMPCQVLKTVWESTFQLFTNKAEGETTYSSPYSVEAS